MKISKLLQIKFVAIVLTFSFSGGLLAHSGIPKSCLDDVSVLAELYNATSSKINAGELSLSFGKMYLATTYQTALNRAKICSEHETTMKERSPLGLYTQAQHLQLSSVFGEERAETLLSFLGLPTPTNLEQKAQAIESAMLSYFDQLIYESHSQLVWDY